MRSLVFDELNLEELEAIKKYLDNNLEKSALAGLYWLEIPQNILTFLQKENLNKEGPYKVAVELEEKTLKFELLVRAVSLENIATRHANDEQILFIANWAKKMATELNLITCY